MSEYSPEDLQKYDQVCGALVRLTVVDGDDGSLYGQPVWKVMLGEVYSALRDLRELDRKTRLFSLLGVLLGPLLDAAFDEPLDQFLSSERASEIAHRVGTSLYDNFEGALEDAKATLKEHDLDGGASNRKGELLTSREVGERQKDATENLEPFIPSQLQERILKALKGQALKVEAVAREIGTDKRRLYDDPGGIKELERNGLVVYHRRVGYYRPDALPEAYPQLKAGKGRP